MNPGKPPTNPMKEGHPEPFPEPRTIPTAWDLSEYLPFLGAGADKADEDRQDAYRREADPDEDQGDFSARL